MAVSLLLPQSAPACQLQKLGNAQSDKVLNTAVGKLSNEELGGLEADLAFYAETGLIGIYMSRLMKSLHECKTPSRAA